MPNLVKMFRTGLTSMVALAIACTCFAVENGRGNAMARDRGTSTMRMPSLPILPVSATGNNTAHNTTPSDPNPNPNPDPDPNPHPHPHPHPQPDPEPDTPVTPTPEPECPDGGVQNSSYTVDSCMNDVLSCVNGGALPNGINSLFNEDLRNSIINGMGLCLSQVETCITTVRRNCQNVYETSADVWLDFNARKIQPEYYSFVLRQTGLTPNQAETTCLLLDRNVYGKSFAAVGINGRPVTSEYNDKIGAYNRQEHNSLDKNNPMGADINTDGLIDGDRGYYARWDAENAQCLVRVAAYNKDKLITNEWLWGAFGNKNPAEVWKSAGSTFTCNKDLFGFPLMRDTRNVALVGIPGGTLLGAGIGALAGHGDRDFDCGNEKDRAKLLKQIREAENGVGIINEYLNTMSLRIASSDMNKMTCKRVIELYGLWQSGKSLLGTSFSCNVEELNLLGIVNFKCETEEGQTPNKYCEAFTGLLYAEAKKQSETGTLNSANLSSKVNAACEQLIRTKYEEKDDENNGKTYEAIFEGTDVCALIKSKVEENLGEYYVEMKGSEPACFRNLNKSSLTGRRTDVLCKKGNKCLTEDEFAQELEQLETVFSGLTFDSEKSNRGKNALIGAGIGAATGGVATGITALIENNNINCRVGDGLGQVSFGKSYTIDRLRDFYVKWALNMPEVPAPTSVVTNCENWELTCNMFDVTECDKVIFNYRANNLSSMVKVTKPCVLSGSACIADRSVAQQQGACQVSPDTSDTPTVPMVKNCAEWKAECKRITRVSDCNTANVIYTPSGMQVRQACVYDTNAHECKINNNKARLYMDISLCPSDPIQIDPNSPQDM